MSRRSGCEHRKGEVRFGREEFGGERGEVKKDERERKKTSPSRPIDCRRLALSLSLVYLAASVERHWIVMSAAESAS